MFAKVKDASVLIYPYTMETLRSENPYTNFSQNKSLIELYEGTEDQIQTGARIVEVAFQNFETCLRNQVVTQNSEPHQDDDGNFVLGYTITEKTGSDLEQAETEILADFAEKIAYIKQEHGHNVSPESTLTETKKAEWVSYFAQLDNLSELEGYPWSFNFPAPPTDGE